MSTARTPLTHAFAAVALALVVFAPATLAQEVTDIGYVDQTALSNIGSFTDASRQLAQYKSQLDGEFAAAMRSAHGADEQARVSQEFQDKLADRQRELFGPLFEKAQIAIASVASSKDLSVVVDKRIVIYGGQDITQSVTDLLTGIGDPVPPVNTPPPSSVGYVDQEAIDATPKLKSATDTFAQFRADQTQQAQSKLKTVKTEADREQVLKDYQDAVAAKEKDIITPLVDQTRDAISDVAKAHHLLLVIDRGDLIYGGTDITADVVKELGG
ncbi:MAG TPA: OmpH family outer membrane protein [Candidatus Acidoferrales bacterium]|nr:OmpH family outer membrane protein [Candidatus Acidoferrales bacterium]